MSLMPHCPGFRWYLPHEGEVPDPRLHCATYSAVSFHLQSMPFCTVYDPPPPLSYLRLTGFLVIVLSMALMAPASMWVRMGATRINELIALSNRPALHDRVDLNPSPRVRRACQVAIFALVMQASNHVRFEEVATCACSDGDYFIQHAVNACCCPVILLVSVPPGQLCFRSRSLFS